MKFSWILTVLLGNFSLPVVSIAQEKTELPKKPKSVSADGKIVTLDLGGKVTLRLVRILKGSFQMGSPKTGDIYARDNEKPQHTVELTKEFYMGETEVTVGQFKRFAAEMGYQTEVEKMGGKISWKDPGFRGEVQTDDHPVVYVSYRDAFLFCIWLGKNTGYKFGLPTEAQWEYACRAGSKTIYSFGDDGRQADRYAWYGENTKGTGTRAVRQKKPNAFGLYDMHGNVFEWCSDMFNEYTTEKRTDPTGPQRGEQRQYRGGSWAADAASFRSAGRGWAVPHVNPGYSTIGFRVVGVPSESTSSKE